MIHPNANLSPNYYAHNDPTSQTFDRPEQVFGDHIHVSHDVSPTCTDSVLAHLSPQEQLTHVRHPYNYYHPSLSLPSSEAELHLDQTGAVALGHGRHMSPVDESPCTSCDPQKFSCPSMSIAMPFSAIRREHSAGSLSIGAASLPSDCTMDDLSFHGAHGKTVSFSSLSNSPQVYSLLAQSYEQQPGWRHYQHGQCQVNSFNSDVTFHDHSETDTSYQGSSSPGSSECTTESIEEPTSTGGSSSSTATRHPCPVPDCGKSFPRASNLKTHMGTHNTHRPFACTFCDYSFARIHDRDRHMNSHLTLKPFACIVCQTRFARQDAVTRHLKMSAETNICEGAAGQGGGSGEGPAIGTGRGDRDPGDTREDGGGGADDADEEDGGYATEDAGYD
ncbi:hypothetical protein BG000_005341 [Podila horticola]|nr:hypothetical protein BG000_005341 [Podila horticola]